MSKIYDYLAVYEVFDEEGNFTAMFTHKSEAEEYMKKHNSNYHMVANDRKIVPYIEPDVLEEA